MTSLLPIAALIEQRSNILGLKRAALVQRLGYRNVAKGLRSLTCLCNGQLNRYPYLLGKLSIALNVSDSEVSTAITDTKAALQSAYDKKLEQEYALYRETFHPHAIILTEGSRPVQLFVVALLGPEHLLRINVDLSTPRDTWLSDAVAATPERVLGFGRPVGVVMNYSPDDAVHFNLATRIATPLSVSERVGRASLSIDGKTLLSTFGSNQLGAPSL